MAGRYDNPIPTRFLAPIDCFKIPARYAARLGIDSWALLKVYQYWLNLFTGTEYTEWQWPLSCVHTILRVKSAYAGKGGMCNVRPTHGRTTH